MTILISDIAEMTTSISRGCTRQLHYIIRNHPTLEVVCDLIDSLLESQGGVERYQQLQPQEAIDSSGCTPAHIAAAEGCEVSIIQRLIMGNKSAQMIDNMGRYPLHYACLYAGLNGTNYATSLSNDTSASSNQSQNEDSPALDDEEMVQHPKSKRSEAIDIITTLIWAYPKAVLYEDNNGATPIKLAKECNASPEIMQLLENAERLTKKYLASKITTLRQQQLRNKISSHKVNSNESAVPQTKSPVEESGKEDVLNQAIKTGTDAVPPKVLSKHNGNMSQGAEKTDSTLSDKVQSHVKEKRMNLPENVTFAIERNTIASKPNMSPKSSTKPSLNVPSTITIGRVTNSPIKVDSNMPQTTNKVSITKELVHETLNSPKGCLLIPEILSSKNISDEMKCIGCKKVVTGGSVDTQGSGTSRTELCSSGHTSVSFTEDQSIYINADSQRIPDITTIQSTSTTTSKTNTRSVITPKYNVPEDNTVVKKCFQHPTQPCSPYARGMKVYVPTNAPPTIPEDCTIPALLSGDDSYRKIPTSITQNDPQNEFKILMERSKRSRTIPIEHSISKRTSTLECSVSKRTTKVECSVSKRTAKLECSLFKRKTTKLEPKADILFVRDDDDDVKIDNNDDIKLLNYLMPGMVDHDDGGDDCSSIGLFSANFNHFVKQTRKKCGRTRNMPLIDFEQVEI